MKQLLLFSFFWYILCTLFNLYFKVMKSNQESMQSLDSSTLKDAPSPSPEYTIATLICENVYLRKALHQSSSKHTRLKEHLRYPTTSSWKLIVLQIHSNSAEDLACSIIQGWGGQDIHQSDHPAVRGPASPGINTRSSNPSYEGLWEGWLMAADADWVYEWGE